MNKFLAIHLVAASALFCGTVCAQQVFGGTGNAIGGNNVDNIAFASVDNIVTVTLTLSDGGIVVLSAPGEGGSPQAAAQSILAQLHEAGGAAAGPLAMAILAGISDLIGGSAAGSH